MFKKTIFVALALATLALYPLVGMSAHVASARSGAIVPHVIRPHVASCANGAASAGDVLIGNVNGTAQAFPSGCYTQAGTGTRCLNAATEVGLFGSSALKPYAIQAGQLYCNQFGIDAEYVQASSCPGVDFASDSSGAAGHPGGNAVGLSDVFPGGCTGAQARPSLGAGDHFDTTNVVNLVIRCPGNPAGSPGAPVTIIPQGGSWNAPPPPAGGSVQTCAGQNGAAVNDASATNAGTGNFCGTNNLSVQAAQQLWKDLVADWSTVGGTVTANCGNLNPNGPFGVSTHNRAVGSGTRITWCFDVFNGTDPCASNAVNPSTGNPVPDASGSTAMLADICGVPYAGHVAAPVTDLGTVGYASRGDILIDPNAPTQPGTTLQNCGTIPVGGATGWNGACNPSAAGEIGTSCSGDNDVQQGTYQIWGYEHFDLNSAGTAGNGGAATFVTWVETNASAQNLFEQFGFIRKCKMNFTRGTDGAPYSYTPSVFPNAPCGPA